MMGSDTGRPDSDFDPSPESGSIGGGGPTTVLTGPVGGGVSGSVGSGSIGGVFGTPRI